MTSRQDATSAKLVRLETFDTAIAVDPTREDAAKRRFMTLLLDTESRSQGNNGCVLRAQNTAGETFAVKVLADSTIARDAGDASATRTAEETARHLADTAALFEEYRNLCAVSHLRGFPRVYGYGTCQGEPLILMEWVEGTSLAHVTGKLPFDASGHTAATVVAAIGCAVLRILLNAHNLSAPILHRDLSPANIILRTSERSIDAQIASLDFDLCLIDLGSSTAQAADGTLTMRADIWRFATPAYAAPEMLTQDVPGVMAKRRSPAVDVYALCSLLYELYSGHLPFDVSQVNRVADGSFYLLKTQQEPQAPRLHDAADQQLLDAIMQGLSVEPDERPSEEGLLRALGSSLPGTAGKSEMLDQEEHSDPVESGTHLTVDIAAERVAAALAQERERAISRRKFIATGIGVGVLAIAGAGAATRGFGLPDYLDGVRNSIADYTWDQLQSLSIRIKSAASEDEARQIAIRYHLLDADGHIPYPATKSVALTDGRTVGAQLIGLRHDSLADGAGKAGLSFIFDRGIARRNAATEPIDGGWKDCELREWLDDAGMKLLPEDLRLMVKPVMKASNNVGGTTDATSISELSASLWLPAMVELVGTQPPDTFDDEHHYLSALYNGEGTEYQLFRELKTTPYGPNDKLKRTWKGNPTRWWQRTVSPDMSEESHELYLNRVGANGDVFKYATPVSDPGKPTCVIPGFCI